MNKKIFFIIISVIIFVIIVCSVGYFILNNNVNFKIIGNNNILLKVNGTYEDEGYNAKLFNIDLKKFVSVSNSLDTSKIGNYKIEYSLSFLWIKKTLSRNIKVVNNINPIITLNNSETINLYIGDNYIEYGAKAINYDEKDISDNIVIDGNVDTKTEGTYTIKYTVSDDFNNNSTIYRKIIVSKKKSNTINNPILNYIVSNNYDISIGYYNLVTKKGYFHNEEKVYFAASLIKTVEALYLYDNNMVNEDTLPYIKKAITVSDNPAHHYLQNLIGQSNLKKYGKSLGAKYTLAGGGVCGNTTVNDQLVFLKRLYEITKKDNEELKSFFMNDYVNYIKFDENIPVMHKYGFYHQVFHDVGIVFDEEPYIVIILTGEPNNYSNVVNKLSKIVYEYHKSI